jgi:hypothetical protein
MDTKNRDREDTEEQKQMKKSRNEDMEEAQEGMQLLSKHEQFVLAQVFESELQRYVHNGTKTQRYSTVCY